MKLSEQALCKLAKEISDRMDFENQAVLTTESAIADPPSSPSTALLSWAKTLQRQKGIATSAGLCVNHSGKLDAITGDPKSENSWRQLLESDFGPRIFEAVSKHRVLHCPLSSVSLFTNVGAQGLLIAPCPASDPPAALGITTKQEPTSFIQCLTDSAATRVALVLSMLRVNEECERGYRQMASRIAHMSSGSMLLAQFRLGAALERNMDAKELQKQVSLAIKDLEDAQQGLDRARLLGVPWSRYADRINLPLLLGTICTDINSAVGKEVVQRKDIESCQEKTGVTVTASNVRLSYALRDLTLGTWMLTTRQAPISMRLSNDGEHALLSLIGSAANLPVEVPEDKIDRLLQDPAVFLSPSKTLRAEQSIGFHLAWSLIVEMGGTISPKFDRSARSICFNVGFPVLKRWEQL